MRHPQQLFGVGGDQQDGLAGVDQVLHVLVDVDIGPDVDADCRLVEDVDPEVRGERSPEESLLLVAAGEPADPQLLVRGLDPKGLHRLSVVLRDLASADDAAPRDRAGDDRAERE